MKLKIKVKLIEKNSIPLPQIIDKGEWIDLRAAKTMYLDMPQADTLKRKIINGEEKSCRDVYVDSRLIPLGIAMQLPKGYEAHLLPRSSTFSHYGIICSNSQGIIDNSYSSNTDEWRLPVLTFREATIAKGDRICQFRIQLSQQATMWQKLKWLFSSGIKLIEVDDLDSKSRGGFGSTGIK
jgi:dUTP pyrophosphatase